MGVTTILAILNALVMLAFCLYVWFTNDSYNQLRDRVIESENNTKELALEVVKLVDIMKKNTTFCNDIVGLLKEVVNQENADNDKSNNTSAAREISATKSTKSNTSRKRKQALASDK